MALTFDQQRLREITFLDIETIPRVPEDHDLIDLFEKKFQSAIDDLRWEKAKDWELKTTEDIIQEFYNQKAGLYAEFGQILSIAIGRVNNFGKLYIKIIASPDEVWVLQKAKDLLDTEIEGCNYTHLCAHNGEEFDFPFTTRRFLARLMKLPKILNTGGRKPWDLPYIDTMKLWAAGQWKYVVSLDLLCKVLNVPSPKQSAVTGKNLYQYWMAENLTQEQKLKMIGEYNGGDVAALANVYCRLKGLPIIEESMIEFVFEKYEPNLLNQ